MPIFRSARLCLWLLLVPVFGLLAFAQRGGPDPATEPFKGVTTDGTVRSGLFAIRSTGVSTRPVREAAVAFISSLTPEQRAKTAYPVDDIEWRRWNNIHRAVRQGVSFKEMTNAQQVAAFDLLKAGLSAKGVEKAHNIMRLNEHIAELTNNFTEYGEGLYHLTVMGEPSDTQPWGWQFEGHHLIVNYFVLRDQVVMTPTFMGSEPVDAQSGKYKGTVVLQDEQDQGLRFMRMLSPEQQQKATLQRDKTANNAAAQAFRDNLVLDFAGLPAMDLTDAQRQRLLALIEEYVGNIGGGHAKVRMEEVRAHLKETYFAWMGATDAQSVFYYRIHSPVILIEFDHQVPVALPGPKVPGRRHVHTVVRTPNGNDYGKDLLRQHYEAHKQDPAHGHVAVR
jgi:predicted nuclease of restriction endonuclease-like (RecB) superfamily